jgi:hypothetical protein
MRTEKSKDRRAPVPGRSHIRGKIDVEVSVACAGRDELVCPRTGTLLETSRRKDFALA